MKLSERLTRWWIRWHDNFDEKECQEMEKITNDLEVN